MGTSSNIKNLIIISTLSASIVPLSYDNIKLAPTIEASYVSPKSVTTWKYNEISEKSSFEINNNLESEKLNIIVSFSKELVDNLIDMDSEFVRIVDDNFWDLM